MKILHTVQGLGAVGGVTTYVEAVARLLAAAGHEVCVTTQGASISIPGVESVLVQRGNEVLRVVEVRQPDIVHLHGWPVGSVLPRLGGPGRPRLVVHHHAYDAICPGRERFWRRQEVPCEPGFGPRCLWNAYHKCCQESRHPIRVFASVRRVAREERAARWADLHLANSTFTARLLIKSGFPEARVAVLNYFTELREDDSTFPVPGRILFLGRIAESKGLDLLIEAVGLLPARIDWSLVIAGEGYDRPRIEALAAELPQTHRVRFVGPVIGRGKQRAIQEASVVVVPSRWWEAFGIVGIEAMACGRPVVAFDTGGVRDWLVDGRTGYAVAKGNAAAMAERIGALLTDPALAKEMGSAGRQAAEVKFHSDTHLSNLVALYQRSRPAQ